MKNINSLEELYDYFNSKEYKDKIKKEVHDILSGKVPQMTDNKNISSKSFNNNNLVCRNNINQNFDSYISLNNSQKTNYSNINSKDSATYHKNHNNNYNRQNYRNYNNNGENYGEWRGRGRGRYRGRGRGRGRCKNYQKYNYINTNSFYNNNEKKNNDLKENENNKKNNKSNNPFINNLNINLEREIDDCDYECEINGNCEKNNSSGSE